MARRGARRQAEHPATTGWVVRGGVRGSAFLFASLLFAAILFVGASVTGCAKKPVVTASEPSPPLEVPVPPPRVLAPVAAAEAPRPEPEPPPEAAKPPRPRPGTRPAPTADTRTDPAQKEPGTETPTTPAPEMPKPAEPAPAPGLRTTQTANETETERRVRDGLARAKRDLQRVNRASLSTDARAQFDTATRFIDQANDALTARNFMFASYLADKAQALARGLASR